MKAENALFNDSRQRQEIEKTGEELPNICVSVFSQTLVIKTIDLSNLFALVISSQDGYPIWVSTFERD